MSPDKVRAAMKSKAKDEPDPTTLLMLQTGYTPLNLACSGKAFGGIPVGKMLWLIGDSDTGKSWLCNTILAEAANDPKFDDYDLVYDNAEEGAVMDVARFWGKKLRDRIRPPKGTWDEPTNSSYLEDFYDTVRDFKKAGKKVVYVLDSMDVLQPVSEAARAEKRANARRAGKGEKEKGSGSMGMDKAKINSAGLRDLHNYLAATGSIAVIVSQTRANVGLDAMFNPKTTSGGLGLKFYCRLQLWMTPAGKLKKKVNEIDRHVGNRVSIAVKKNHVCGWLGKVQMPFYFDFGIDDVGGCVNYLVQEGHWKVTKGRLTAPEFEFQGRVEDLVKKIEVLDAEKTLRKLASRVWRQVLKESKIERKARYE